MKTSTLAAQKYPRFSVQYHITASCKNEAEDFANDIAIEQTVEAPKACLLQSHWNDGIIGVVEEIQPHLSSSNLFCVTISYRTDITAFTVPQFFNTLYGNISLKNNVQIVGISPASELSHIFKGPSYGIEGIRTLLHAFDRPLACSALKPMGLSVDELAKIAYSLAKGGIDCIKDDHGITDQSFHPFYERIRTCQNAVDRANKETGGNTLYFPSLCGPYDSIDKQARFANDLGVRGILVAPMLIGLDTIRYLSSTYNFVMIGHPALTGTFFSSDTHGIEPGIFLGLLYRLLGIDISVFPNAGGRFPMTKLNCQSIAYQLRQPLAPFKSAFPCPAGGITLEKVNDVVNEYGADTVLLIGGSLLSASNNLSEATSVFMNKIHSFMHK